MPATSEFATQHNTQCCVLEFWFQNYWYALCHAGVCILLSSAIALARTDGQGEGGHCCRWSKYGGSSLDAHPLARLGMPPEPERGRPLPSGCGESEGVSFSPYATRTVSEDEERELEQLLLRNTVRCKAPLFVLGPPACNRHLEEYLMSCLWC